MISFSQIGTPKFQGSSEGNDPKEALCKVNNTQMPETIYAISPSRRQAAKICKKQVIFEIFTGSTKESRQVSLPALFEWSGCSPILVAGQILNIPGPFVSRSPRPRPHRPAFGRLCVCR